MGNVVATPGGQQVGRGHAGSAITLESSDRVFSRFQFEAGSILVALVVLHVGVHRAFGDGPLNSSTAVFEAGITTVISMLNPLVASVLLFVLYLNASSTREALSHYWLIMSVVILALSVDEVAPIHERVGNILRGREWSTRTTDFNPDYVVNGLFTLVVLVAFISFLRRLDRTTRVWFLVAGGLFGSGALGMELVELALLRGRAASAGDALLDARAVVEEAGEMDGVALFNVVLFRLSQRQITFT